jgi:hypothetical protein
VEGITVKTIDPKHMTEDMARASNQVLREGEAAPHKGDRFRCDSCGMEIQVTADCQSHGDGAHFHCCGQAMHKV